MKQLAKKDEFCRIPALLTAILVLVSTLILAVFAGWTVWRTIGEKIRLVWLDLVRSLITG